MLGHSSLAKERLVSSNTGYCFLCEQHAFKTCFCLLVGIISENLSASIPHRIHRSCRHKGHISEVSVYLPQLFITMLLISIKKLITISSLFVQKVRIGSPILTKYKWRSECGYSQWRFSNKSVCRELPHCPSPLCQSNRTSTSGLHSRFSLGNTSPGICSETHALFH